MEVTLTLTTPAARVATAGTKAIAEFRNSGGGSNRSQWARMEAVLIACMTVVATGKAVEITDDFFFAKGEEVADGTSPWYNTVHRVLSTEIVRPYWENVKPYALVNVREANGQVTGTSRTEKATKAGMRLFIGPPQ